MGTFTRRTGRGGSVQSLKSESENGFVFGSLLLFATVEQIRAARLHSSLRRPSAIQKSSRNVSGPGSTPTTPASW